MSKKLLRVALVAAMFTAACADDTTSSPPPSPAAPAAPAAAPAAPVEQASGRVASTDSRADVPTFIWADAPTAAQKARRAAAKAPASAAEAARQHVARFASYYRLSPQQVSELELRDLHDTGRGAIIARYGRRVDGVEVFGEQLSVAMDRSLEVVALSGFVTGDVPGVAKIPGRRARDAFNLGTARATQTAMSDLSGVIVADGDFESPVTVGDYQVLRLRPSGALRTQAAAVTEPSRGKKVFFRAGSDGLVPAYYVELDLGNDEQRRPRSFSYVVAADDGRVLSKRDLTAYDNPVTYRVYADDSGLFTPWDGPQGTEVTPHPTGLPDGFQPGYVPSQLVTLSSLTAVDVNDPWLPPGATETLGNNVDAYLDISAPDGFTLGSNDFRGTTSSPGVFDYVFDTSLGAGANVTQRLAAVTQLFYDNNWFHDWYYAAGFTETAGNAQFSNYGRGGLEGDGLRAEAQDNGGFNNANMSTPSDGARPRMQMFLWTKPTELRISVATPATLAGDFTRLGTASFGPLSFSASGDIVRANPADACTPLVGDYVGKIVFVDRGGVAACNGFAGKTERVQAAGGAAIIIANVATSNDPTNPPLMGGTPVGPVTIGAVSLNVADGDRFRAELNAGSAVSGAVVRTVQLLDGDIDNQIVAHEWGHYISNRLIGNATGLDTNMAGGLGEGWADFHAMLITVREEDIANPLNTQWEGVYGIGAYATQSDPNSYYFGIRRYPYSTDMTKNPMTFKHISDVNPLPTVPAPNFRNANSEVHSTGEVWTTMLWESYAGLLRDTLGPSPRLTFAEARDRMRDYIVAGYKLTPASPTLLEARDAILLAALINDPADYEVIGAAFAKRGAGVNAVAPPRGEFTNTPVVESFAFAPSLRQTGATLVEDGAPVCAADSILDDGETAILSVTFKNVGSGDTAGLEATVTTTTDGITFPDGATLAIPAIPRGGSAEATVRVAASGLAPASDIALTVSTPDAGAGEATPVSYSFPGNADEVAGQSTIDTAERSASVWVVTSSLQVPPADAVWTRVSTSSTNHAYRCRSANETATVELMSPQIAVPPGQTLSFSFSHRFSFERAIINGAQVFFDGGVIELSTDNGATWADVSTVAGLGGYTGLLAAGGPLAGRPAFTGTSVGYPAFNSVSVNLGTGFGGRLVRIRFRVASDPGVGSPGWELDDIQINGGAAPLFQALVPQSATCNNQPIASAGANQSVPESGPAPVFAPTTVFLDGSASLDPNGDPLGYQWTQVGGPAVTLSDATARTPSFFAPAVLRTPSPTPLVFQLVVSDGTIASAAKLTTVNVVNVNRPPVAIAGPTQTAAERSLVTLDGSASADPDADDVLTYQWAQIAGPPVTLSSTTARQPTFAAPEVSFSGADLSFSLTVSDGLATSAPATATVHVTNVNREPTANAGSDQTVSEGALVTLDGTASSDPDGDALIYTWSAPAGVELSDASAARPTFTAPAVTPAGASFTFSLVVSDAAGATSAPDSVTVTVTNLNRAPTANAGAAQTVNERTLVTLDGSGSSDPDGDALTFEWVAPPGITLGNATAARPTFTAPDVGVAGATFRFTLIVRDPAGLASAAATVDIKVKNVNRPPVANAGADRTVREGDLVVLHGSGSDPDGDAIAAFRWTAPNGILLFGAHTATPFFFAPGVRRDTSYTLSLVVTDALGAQSVADSVVVTVRERRR